MLNQFIGSLAAVLAVAGLSYGSGCGHSCFVQQQYHYNQAYVQPVKVQKVIKQSEYVQQAYVQPVVKKVVKQKKVVVPYVVVPLKQVEYKVHVPVVGAPIAVTAPAAPLYSTPVVAYQLYPVYQAYQHYGGALEALESEDPHSAEAVESDKNDGPKTAPVVQKVQVVEQVVVPQRQKVVVQRAVVPQKVQFIRHNNLVLRQVVVGNKVVRSQRFAVINGNAFQNRVFFVNRGVDRFRVVQDNFGRVQVIERVVRRRGLDLRLPFFRLSIGR